MVIASRMCTYVQTHQIIYIEHVQFFVYQLYVNKAVLKNSPPAGCYASFCNGGPPMQL